MTDDIEHQKLIGYRDALKVQRAELDAEIKRLSERIEFANQERLAPILKAQQERERAAREEAARTGKSVVYIDHDGCEVECTQSGHSFYNAADWY